MDIRKVKKLIEMLEESQLNEIEIKEGEESVKLVKAISAHVQEQIITSNAVAPAPAASNCE
jgi:acetyl-CoA carboxylase biotin carboxyl carrier protein